MVAGLVEGILLHDMQVLSPLTNHAIYVVESLITLIEKSL